MGDQQRYSQMNYTFSMQNYIEHKELGTPLTMDVLTHTSCASFEELDEKIGDRMEWMKNHAASTDAAKTILAREPAR